MALLLCTLFHRTLVFSFFPSLVIRRSSGILLLFTGLLTAGTGCTKQLPRGPWIDHIYLRGVKAVSPGKLLKGLAIQESSWWPFSEKVWFEPADLDQDLQRISAFYAARGYFNTKVTESKVTPGHDHQVVDILIAIDEGQPTKISQLKIDGLTDLPSEVQGEISSKITLSVGQQFKEATYQTQKAKIVAHLKTLGYAFAQVSGSVRVERTANLAAIRFEVLPGPLVRFGKPLIEGNGPLPADKLARQATWSEGDRFDSRLLDETKNRLLELRMVSPVQLSLPTMPTRIADIRIKVSPLALREWQVGGGFGIDQLHQEIRLKAQHVRRNFLGGLRTLTINLKPSYVFLPNIWDHQRHGPAVKTDVQLLHPDLFRSHIFILGLLGYELGIHEGYRYHGPRGSLGLGRSFFDGVLTLGSSWNLRFYDFFDQTETVLASNDPFFGLDNLNGYRLAWLEQSIQVDLRNDPLDPSWGLLGTFRFEQGFPQIASQFTYLKLMPELRGYLPLGTSRLVLALRARYDLLITYDAASPISQRVFFGGPTSHRGFSSNRLSPQVAVKQPQSATQTVEERLNADNLIPIGGDVGVLFSSDLRLKVLRLAGYWLLLSAFLDAGEVATHPSDLDLAQLHLAVGGSIEYQSPMGTFRTGIGVRLNRVDQETNGARSNPDPFERWAFHLTLGHAF